MHIAVYTNHIACQIKIPQSTTGANTTIYLHGLNQIGEFGSQTAYYLVDGVGSVRQVVDQTGSIVFARWYDPFGQIIKQNGGGDALYGYLGAQFDRISGLLYINGAYYDPVTGRFLSPSSGGSNPYAPLGGAALAPILILALIGRKRKGKIWTGWVAIVLMMSVGILVAACGAGGSSSPPPLMPKSGAEPVYDPSSWNNASLQESNNCYSYAVNDRNIHIDTTGGYCKPQPGVKGGSPLQGLATCSKASNAVLADGLLAASCDKACPANTYKVALVVDTTGITDYHFYRQDASGYWSSKRGELPVTNLDSHDEQISDPRNAHRDYGTTGRDPITGLVDSLDYDAFCGCFCVPVGIQTQCLR